MEKEFPPKIDGQNPMKIFLSPQADFAKKISYPKENKFLSRKFSFILRDKKIVLFGRI
jgi:hypothetical protein